MGPETQTDFRTQEIAYAEVLLAQGFRYCLGRLRNDLRQATCVRRGDSTCVIEAFLPYQRQEEERRELILGRLLVYDLGVDGRIRQRDRLRRRSVAGSDKSGCSTGGD